MRRRNVFGATCARDLAIWPAEAAAYERLSRTMPFTLRVSVGIEGRRIPDALDFASKLGPVKRGNPWFVADVLGEEPWPPAGATTAEFTRMALLARRASLALL